MNELDLPANDPVRVLIEATRPEPGMLDRFIESDIPYRLQGVDGLAWYSRRSKAGADHDGLVLQVHGLPIPPAAYTNAVIEMGLASVRAQAEFLGFKVHLHEDRLTDAKREMRTSLQCDAWLEHFNRKRVTKEDARNAGYHGATAEATESALVYALRKSNAAVAHLTFGPLGLDPSPVELACETLWKLTIERLYDGNGDDVNRFRYPAEMIELAAAMRDGRPYRNAYGMVSVQEGATDPETTR